MKEKPDIVKMLEEEERLGILQSRVQKNYDESELSDESFEDVPDETVGFIEDDNVEKGNTVSDTDGYEQTVKGLQDSNIYRTIFENVNDVIIYVDKHGKVIDVNKRIEDIFGYKPEEIIGKNFSRLGWFGVRDLPKMLKLFKGALRGKTIDLLELEVKHRDGHIVHVEVSTRPVRKNGKTVGFLSIVRDITERKKATNEIEKAKHELEVKNQELENTINYADRISLETKNALTELDQIFNSTADGMLVIDKDFHILKMNNTFSTMFGISKAETIGGKCYEVLNGPAGHTNNCTMKDILEGKGRVEFETEIEHADGTMIPCSLTATPFKKVDGEIISVIENFKDITEWKKAEERIKKQNVELEKLNDLKSAFLNITSHELRTPMSSIKGYIQMLLRRNLGEINEEQKKALEVVLRNADRLDHLIQDILDISRLESGTMKFVPEKTNLQKMINEIAETMQSSADLKNIKIDVDIKEKIPDLIIDQDRIKQVVINLVNNAIKFSWEGTSINIKARKEKSNILFEVQDFGRGIPKDKQEKIFETFYQVDSGTDTKFGGAGLGLAISRGIVLAHMGTIWVESKGKPGEGSTFHFTLPIKAVKDIEDRFKKVDVFGLETRRVM